MAEGARPDVSCDPAAPAPPAAEPAAQPQERLTPAPEGSGMEAPDVTSGREGCGKRLVRPPIVSEAEGWASASGLTQREAEELLDWLEANGFIEREVHYLEAGGISVRWRR
jgi:hypothetical protein